MEYQTYQAIVSEQKFSGGLFLKIRRVPKQAKKEGMTAPNVVYW